MGLGTSTQEPEVVEEQVEEEKIDVSESEFFVRLLRLVNVEKQPKRVPASIQSLLKRSSSTNGTS